MKSIDHAFQSLSWNSQGSFLIRSHLEISERGNVKYGIHSYINTNEVVPFVRRSIHTHPGLGREGRLEQWRAGERLRREQEEATGAAHLRGADDGAAREEERHARGEVEGAREPHPGRHVELRPAGGAQAVDASHGARERDRVERPPVPRAAEAGHGHPRPAPRWRRHGSRARLLRARG